MRISSLDPNVVRWVLGRARAFDKGTGRPVFRYPEIARNLFRARRVRLSGKAVKRLVVREDPELERRRAGAWNRG
ncbi:MAG: hypothetical protein M3547_05375 [Acidobacteriota bacterium]|nr:hypothetical protein [Acidobacteriota bacterium]